MIKNEIDEQNNKLYYSIGEVAQMLDVNSSLIRFWEKEFADIKPKKNRKGNRLFTNKDISNLRFIYHLVKEQGHTLEGAKKILKNRKTDAARRYVVVQTLENLRALLIDLRGNLDNP